MDSIRVVGASEHNLKDIDVEIPRDALTVITGLSGSGKSSLAFDTIYQEGQRRFMESLSAYARQFLGSMEKPHVEHIEGLSPTLSIDQKTVNRNPRSTVGTITEIFDHQRLLMARLGTARCPICLDPITSSGPGQITERLMADQPGAKLHIMAPIVQGRKGEYRKELADALGQGFIRARIDGELRSLEEDIVLARYEKHHIELVIDRLKAIPEHRARLVEAVEMALDMADGTVTALVDDQHKTFSAKRACPKHDVSIPEMEPRLFSFNAPQGMCQTCVGIGWLEDFDLELLIDANAKITDAVVPLNQDGRLPFSSLSRDALKQVCKKLKIPLRTKWHALSAEQEEALLNGAPIQYQVIREREGRSSKSTRTWSGILPICRHTWSFARLNRLASVRRRVQCPTCQGARLNPIALAVDFQGKNIAELTSMSIVDAQGFFSSLKLQKAERQVGGPILKEILGRLGFLDQVGLGYLSLDRSAATLSGGEAQRIRLASQVGAGLQGVTYVLDEPSIGLHARDHDRLLDALVALKDKGNTVIVVEHDPATMARADYLMEIGPGAGRLGGHLIAAATYRKFLRSKALTAKYLRGTESIPIPEARRRGNGHNISILGANVNNLQQVDLTIPLGCLVTVTGVSGSGKSSLIVDTLYRAAAMALQNATVTPGAHDQITGLEHVDKVIEIDQAPIGRTPRSNPATYTGAFDPIRTLFAQLPISKERAYKKGQFSFNVAGGRCEECQGAGVRVIEMQFLSDVQVPCDACGGHRFNPETLEVRFRGRTIADVLAMSIDEAAAFFKNHRKINRILSTMQAVGLGYVALGQPSTTLSGGEAQRVKLATELQRPSTGQTLYILDEPTTGLHMQDVGRLLEALNKLVDAGNTVVVIEHNTDVIKVSDWIVDLGPEGGVAGGQIVGNGTPEHIGGLDTPTGRMLAKELGGEFEVHEPKRRRRAKKAPKSLTLRGVETHNLKSIDITIPHDKTTVITGVSGSGKSSLAFHTLFAEGQRRYVESLSTYARRFLGRLDKARLEKVEGLRPAIAIDQRNRGHNPRSTVATVTEIYDGLRLLYARIGHAHCPHCSERLQPLSPSAAARWLTSATLGAGTMLAELTEAQVAGDLLRDGYLRVWDGVKARELTDPEEALPAGTPLVIDRFNPGRASRERVVEAVETAYGLADNRCIFRPKSGADVVLTRGAVCPQHGNVIPEELNPRHFSFNSHQGACQTCAGVGRATTVDPDLLIPNPQDALEQALDGRVATLLFRSARSNALMEAVLKQHNATLDTPPTKWTKSLRKAMLYGCVRPVEISYTRSWGRNSTEISEKRPWVGFIPIVRGWKSSTAWLQRETTCPDCAGGRLQPQFLAVTIGDSPGDPPGLSISDTCALTVEQALAFWTSLALTPNETAIAEQVLQEITSKLGFLIDVGLGYLTLDRRAESLSGGEAQRIRLATQLGSRLTGVIYVLDEPTVGLHPRDTERLMDTLDGLQKLGNTLVIVEHDEEVMRRADHIIDMGPGAGEDGGLVVAEGPVGEITASGSVTGQYLSGQQRIPTPGKRRKPKGWFKMPKSSLHNLKDVSLHLPKGCLTVMTGVSGSGKSTLLLDVAQPHLKALKKGPRIVTVDQRPIGRTPRSIPATYIGIIDPIRKLFTQVPLARERGWRTGRFSFNQHTGRCAKCEGRGAILVEMHFLSDVWVPCEACGGRRYNRETLEARWKGASIADVLDMRVTDALAFFSAQRNIKRRLQAMEDVGLGYLRLGQPATTLSGGEAQRLKLAVELLSRPDAAVYLLDEPTTGLHMADIEKLVQVLHRLVDAGHTIVVIEHHPDVIWNADHVIDMGPEGGDEGGTILATCTPEELVDVEKSHTGRALRLHHDHLEVHSVVGPTPAGQSFTL